MWNPEAEESQAVIGSVGYSATLLIKRILPTDVPRFQVPFIITIPRCTPVWSRALNKKALWPSLTRGDRLCFIYSLGTPIIDV